MKAERALHINGNNRTHLAPSRIRSQIARLAAQSGPSWKIKHREGRGEVSHRGEGSVRCGTDCEMNRVRDTEYNNRTALGAVSQTAEPRRLWADSDTQSNVSLMRMLCFAEATHFQQ